MKKFEVIFLTEAREFLIQLNEESREKIIFNVDKAKIKTDNELFKKLKGGFLELYAIKLISEFLPFGTKKIKHIGFSNPRNHKEYRQNTRKRN